MPSIAGFEIVYEALNNEKTFSEGDNITGSVILKLMHETKVESIFVKAKGDANTHWTIRRNDRTHTCKEHIRVFKVKQFLVPESTAETVLPKGTHQYNFNLKIPSGNMPSSFKGTYGDIVYKLEAKISRSWKLDRTVERELNFVSNSFCNIDHLRSPRTASTDKEMGLFSKGRVHMDVNIDGEVFTQGEEVAIVAKVNNSSSRDMVPTFSLKRKLIYRANGHNKQTDDVICRTIGNNIPPGTVKRVTCDLTIPSNTSPTIRNCNIISVEYVLKVYLDISFASDPGVKFPVLIIPPSVRFHPSGAIRQHLSPAATSQINSNPHPNAVPFGTYSRTPWPGTYRYPVAPGPGADDYLPPTYPGQTTIVPSAPQAMGGSSPLPQRVSPYGSPFSSSSPSPVHHPPPSAPMLPPPVFHPPPTAPPAFDELPSNNLSLTAPASSLSPTVPTYNLPPTILPIDTNFLSQEMEDPPSYASLFPSSAPKKSNSSKSEEES